MSPSKQPQQDNPDLLGGFASPTNKTSANGDFADFNPRQGEGKHMKYGDVGRSEGGMWTEVKEGCGLK